MSSDPLNVPITKLASFHQALDPTVTTFKATVDSLDRRVPTFGVVDHPDAKAMIKTFTTLQDMLYSGLTALSTVASEMSDAADKISRAYQRAEQDNTYQAQQMQTYVDGLLNPINSSLDGAAHGLSSGGGTK
jgi:hypothetical protein